LLYPRNAREIKVIACKGTLADCVSVVVQKIIFITGNVGTGYSLSVKCYWRGI